MSLDTQQRVNVAYDSRGFERKCLLSSEVASRDKSLHRTLPNSESMLHSPRKTCYRFRAVIGGGGVDVRMGWTVTLVGVANSDARSLLSLTKVVEVPVDGEPDLATRAFLGLLSWYLPVFLLGFGCHVEDA